MKSHQMPFWAKRLSDDQINTACGKGITGLITTHALASIVRAGHPVAFFNMYWEIKYADEFHGWYYEPKQIDWNSIFRPDFILDPHKRFYSHWTMTDHIQVQLRLRKTELIFGKHPNTEINPHMTIYTG